MRQSVTCMVLVALVSVLLPSPSVWASASVEWVTRGKDQARSQTADLKLGAIEAVPAWASPPAVGASGSQPLFVGNRIYHLAGDSLWEITPEGAAEPLVGGLNRLKDDPGRPRPSTSGITYVDDPGGAALYFGTGDNQLCVLRLHSRGYRCVSLTARLSSEEPIVTVPLVYRVEVGGRASDVVVMGDKNGRLWVVQDLLHATTRTGVKMISRQVGGWVLASPVGVGSPGNLTFVWGNDLGPLGKIGAYRILPSDGTQPLRIEPAWVKEDNTQRTVDTYAGVTDGFARDGEYVYASDKAGNFYRVNALNGTYTDLRYSTTAGPMFANASPAVDDEHIYFAIRNVGTASPSATHPGRLVALDKASFKVVWTADLPAPANTNPLVWAAGPNVVLVGDTKGTIHAFDRKTGKASPFAINRSGPGPDGRYQCTPTASLNVGITQQADQHRLYQNLTGITDPILASGTTDTGLLLFGLSGRQGSDYVGWLHAYAAGGAYNVSWTQTTLPDKELPVGQEYTVKGQLTWAPWGLAPGTGARNFTVQAFLAPEGGAPGRKIHEGTVTLQPNQPADYLFAFTPLESDAARGKVEVYVNPQLLMVNPGEMGQRYRITAGYTADPVTGTAATDGLLPGQCAHAESELLQTGSGSATADNLLEQAVTISKLVDLSVSSLTMPRNVACGQNLTAQYTLRNGSGRTVPGVRHTVRVLASGNWHVLRSATAGLEPGDTPLSITVPGTPCGEVLRVEVSVNPDRTIPETTYVNNTRSDAPVVLYYQPQWNWSGGGTNVLIVPADCVPNPDPTSSQPCTNYPGLIIP